MMSESETATEYQWRRHECDTFAPGTTQIHEVYLTVTRAVMSIRSIYLRNSRFA